MTGTDKYWDLIVVGLGDLGSRVADECHKNGLNVLGIRRQKTSMPYATQALDIHSEQLEILNLKCRCLLFSVAADSRTDESYQKTYLSGLKRVLTWIKADTVINISSTRVFAPTTEYWITEDSPRNPADTGGEILSQAAALLQTGSCNLYLGGIYGPGRNRLITMAKQGYWCQPGNKTNRIHIADAVGISCHLINMAANNRFLPSSIMGVDGQAADQANVLSWLRNELSTPANKEHEIKVTSSGKRCKSIELDNLGYRFIYPDFEHGYKSILDLEE